MALDILKNIFTGRGTGPTRDKLISKGGEIAGQAIGTAIATRPTDADIYNQDRIAQLQRQQELGMLGLTEQERAQLQGLYGGQLLDIGREGEARRRQQMAAFDTFGGAALQQAALTDQALAEAQMKATASIAEADIKRQAMREAELQKRMELEGMREAKQRGAYGELVGKGISELATLPSEIREEEGAIDPGLIKMVREKFPAIGSDAEAITVLRTIKKDPELGALLTETL